MRRTRRKSYGDASARWPESVFGVGDEPDPRFTFANQRTLLAWIRTALACILGAAVIDALAVEVTPTVRAAGIVVLSALGAMSAIHGWRSWRRSELALRRSEPLPGSAGPSLLLASGIVVAACLVLVLASEGLA